jgi:hypothetical protein
MFDYKYFLLTFFGQEKFFLNLDTELERNNIIISKNREKDYVYTYNKPNLEFDKEFDKLSQSGLEWYYKKIPQS